MIEQHATLPPSGAHIWAPEKGCRASVRMQRQFPGPPDSPEALEGTAAHWYVTETLEGRPVPVGSVAPNGQPITQEMVDCGDHLITDVCDTIRANPGGVLRVEQRVFMHSSVHPANDGTPDAVYVLAAQRRAFVWDYKYGHRYVDAAGNWQTIDYGIGVLEGEGCNVDVAFDHPQSFRGWRVSLNIVQPRNYHPTGPAREWNVSGEQLADYARVLRKSAYEAMDPTSGFQTGEHCRDCSARHACPALQRAGAIAMDVALHAQPVELSPHAVGLELRQIDDAIKRLEARQTGLEEHALGLLRGGTRVPFFSAQHASGRETWEVPAEQVMALGDNFGLNLRKAATLTPAQARKAGLPAEAMQGMAGKPMGALKLTRVDDDAAKLAFE